VSREDVEVVRAIYERWRRGDSARELFDPEVEWSTPHPDASAIRGREELLAFLRRYAGTWQDYRIELEEIRDVGEHRVLVLFSEAGAARAAVWKHAYDRRGYGPCATDGRPASRHTPTGQRPSSPWG
jgi:ketosteroid isomerase-like protein